MKTRYIAITTFLLGCLSIHAYSQDVVMPDSLIRTGKLANGITYFIRKNTMPKGQADFHLVQKVGSVLENEDQRGLAHFLEHMAFNGTKHFPGNTMVSELEKKGIKFGTNINAYTGYDETVYRLTNIPVSREGVLDTALLVLHDWSGFILNTDKDIDEERKVIREEWRTRSTGYLRVQESQVIPVLLQGTPYANRLPIGSMDIVMNFKYKQLKDYYNKWYRPDLQAVIVVGDVDVDKVEKKLSVLFGSIPKPIKPAPREYVVIPDNRQPIIAIASDPEIRNASAVIYWRQKNYSPEQGKSVQFFKMRIINELISNLINQRFSELAGKNRSWNSVSMMGKYSVAANAPAWTLDLNVPDNKLLDAMKADLIEIERIRRFGFNKNELDPTIRKFHLMLNETGFYDQQQIQNSQLTDEIIKQYLKSETFPGQSWKYKMTQKILTDLTIDTLSFYAKKYLNASNIAVAILSPVKTASPIPTKTEVLKLLAGLRTVKLKPWVKDAQSDDFASLVTPKSRDIIKTEQITAPFGFTKWELSNGVNVWFKNTGYRESKVLAFGFKPGGFSQVATDDLPSALAYNQITVKAKGFGGADGLIYRDELNQYSTYVTSAGTIMNLKVMFQNIYLQMTKFKTELQDVEDWKITELERLKSRGIVPKEVFGDTLKAIMSNHNPRAISLRNPEIVKQVSYKNIKELHKHFFGNAKDFNFIIVGNLNADTVKHLAETWLGGLPYDAKSSSKIVDYHIYPPRGIIKKEFSRRMETPQLTITIGYTGEIPYTYENRNMITIISSILKRRYMEKIREKEGGSYGIGVNAELIDVPKERYIFQITFDTAPDSVKKKRLLEIVYQEINKLKDSGLGADELNIIKQASLKDDQELISKQDAKYWYNKQGVFLLYGRDFGRSTSDILAVIDSAKIQAFAKQIFEQGNLIQVIMDPE